MNKTLLVTICVVLAFAVVGCNDSSSGGNKNPVNQNPVNPNGNPGGVCATSDDPNCTSDSLSLGEQGDKDGDEERLIGRNWKLIEVSVAKYDEVTNLPEEPEIINYSAKGIYFEFQGNNKLVITGKTDSLFVFDGFKDGEHFYKYYNRLAMHNLYVDYPNKGDRQLAGLGKPYFLSFDERNMEIWNQEVVGGVIDESGLIVGGNQYRWIMSFIKSE